jgi:hypothetical protein
MSTTHSRPDHVEAPGIVRPGGLHPSYAVLREIMATFLDRYLAGEYVAVWDDLIALGPQVRQKRYCADAATVAAETMRRARNNVELLVKRLEGMEYRFLTPEVYEENHRQAASRLEGILNRAALRSSICDGTWASAVAFRKSKEHLRAVQEAAGRSRGMAIEFIEKAMGSQPAALKNRSVIDRPTKQTASKLDKLETMVGGPLPLAMRAWYEQVGGVSLLGWHSSLCPNPDEPARLSEGAPEPLAIYPLDTILAMAADERKRYGTKIEGFTLWAGAPGTDFYRTDLPSKCADDIFDHRRRRTFVNYLRRVFAWGGFPAPGKARPSESVAKLKEGLFPL